MTDKEPKKSLVGPWRSLHGVIWLVGLYILATRGWWWPGILVLVGISALYEGLLQRLVPEAYIAEEPKEPLNQGEMRSVETDPLVAAPVVQEHRLELLPQVCPSYNAPIRGHEVKWTGAQSANCPYCGTNLPMNKSVV